jgi:hypothetical protein
VEHGTGCDALNCMVGGSPALMFLFVCVPSLAKGGAGR